VAESIIKTFKPEEWGEVVSLQAGYTLLDKDGKVIEEKSWKSHSYVRNFGRLIQHMFDAASFSITDFGGTAALAQWAQNFSSGRFVPRPNENANGFGFNYTGAMMNIGTGPLTGEDSSFFNLKTPFLATPEDARLSVFTTQEDTVAHEFAIQQGITNASNSTATITEQALFSRVRTNNGPAETQAPNVVMFAYDEVNPGVVVAVGQTFVPRYTLRFQA
jgi:hypothetical protein